MKLFSKNLPPEPKKISKRSFDLKNVLSRFLKGTAHKEYQQDIQNVRDTARELAEQDGYFSNFLNLLATNVVHNGIQLRVNLRNPDGSPNLEQSNKIERRFKEWCQSVTTDGRLSFLEAQQLFERSRVIDGEVFVRLYRNSAFKDGLALQFIEADQINERFDKNLSNGHVIRSGIEHDQLGRVIAYWVLKHHPSDTMERNNEAVRIPADEIIHAFHMKRASQVRGISECRSAFGRLKKLSAYEDAEISAAKRGARMDLVFTQSTLEEDDEESRDLSLEFQADEALILPRGLDLQPIDNKHPTTQYGAFTKQALSGVANGLGLSYNILTGDLASTSYSSLREGKLAARDFYRSHQRFLIERFCKPVFELWLASVLITENLGNFQAINRAASWQTRGWEWVDPVKDAQSTQIQLSLGAKTLREVVNDQGKDFEDHIAGLQAEIGYLNSLGISHPYQLINNNDNNEDLDEDVSETNQD